MSQTPRTDAQEHFIWDTMTSSRLLPRAPYGFVSSEFARKLESEIHELQREVLELRLKLDPDPDPV